MTEFSPTPEAAAALIESFLDPAVSLDDLARRASTSTEALSLWLSRPEIQERLAGLDNTAALRTRMVAGAQLPVAAKSLSTILADFNAGRLTPEPDQAEQHTPTPTLRLRAAMCIVRASNALIRLSRFAPGPSRRPESTKESPERELGSQLPLRASGGGGRVREAGGGVPSITTHSRVPPASHPRVPLASSSGLASAIAPTNQPTSHDSTQSTPPSALLPASPRPPRSASTDGQPTARSDAALASPEPLASGTHLGTGQRPIPPEANHSAPNSLSAILTPTPRPPRSSPEDPRYLTDEEIDARLAELDKADAQLAEIAAQLGISDDPDTPPEVLEAMLEAFKTGDTTNLSPELAAVIDFTRTHATPDTS